MKSIQKIYEDIKNRFFKDTGIDIERGTAIDYFVLASSNMLEEAHQVIEDNKTPHIYSSLYGERIDDMGILCGVTRKPDESDKNFLYRLLQWNISNKAANSTAIETALMNLKNSSNVTYVPHAFGCGTAAAYIIPKVMDEEGIKLATEEVKDVLADVVSPSTYIEYIIPTVRQVRITCSFKATAADKKAIKDNISSKVVSYINGIAPGNYLEIGHINKIGFEEPNVQYFNVTSLNIDGKEIGEVSVLQKVESKFIITEDNIILVEVE